MAATPAATFKEPGNMNLVLEHVPIVYGSQIIDNMS